MSSLGPRGLSGSRRRARPGRRPYTQPAGHQHRDLGSLPAARHPDCAQPPRLSPPLPARDALRGPTATRAGRIRSSAGCASGGLARWAGAVSRVIAVSRHLVDRHSGVFPHAATHVIRNPFPRLDLDSLRRPSVPPGTIGYLGNLASIKGLGALLDARAELNRLGVSGAHRGARAYAGGRRGGRALAGVAVRRPRQRRRQASVSRRS